MDYKNIKLEKRENYAILQIANTKNNSLDEKTLLELSYATKNLNKDRKIKCIGLKGNINFFSPGADIKELEKLDFNKAKKLNYFLRLMNFKKLIFQLSHLSKAMLLEEG